MTIDDKILQLNAEIWNIKTYINSNYSDTTYIENLYNKRFELKKQVSLLLKQKERKEKLNKICSG